MSLPSFTLSFISILFSSPRVARSGRPRRRSFSFVLATWRVATRERLRDAAPFCRDARCQAVARPQAGEVSPVSGPRHLQSPLFSRVRDVTPRGAARRGAARPGSCWQRFHRCVGCVGCVGCTGTHVMRDPPLLACARACVGRSRASGDAGARSQPGPPGT